MTIRAGGIKVSHPLAQLDVARGGEADGNVAALVERLAKAQINLSLLAQPRPPAPQAATLCVAEADRARAEEIAQGITGLRLTVRCPVVAVSVFPHRSQARLLLAILRALARQELAPLGLATSLSALTITLAASDLARGLAGLDAVLELPDNHAPLRWELLVKQAPP